MKKLKILIGLAGLGVMAFAGSRAYAFPLTLTGISGTMTCTHSYGLSATNTSNVALKVAVGLPRILTVLSNEVFLDLGSAPPANMRIALDPYTGSLYLTNSSGFFYDIEGNGLGSFNIREVATTFTTNSTTTLSEQDRMVVSLQFNGRQPNGETFEFSLRGCCKFVYQLNSAGVGTVTLAGSGLSGYGEFNSSDDGVSLGSFKAAGTGTPEWTGPFSIYWWWN